MTAAPEIAVVIPFGAGFHTDALRSFDSGRCKCLVDPMAAQENPTLSAVLEEHSILFPPTSIPHLDTKITSFARFDDDLEFVITYYLDNPKNELQAPFASHPIQQNHRQMGLYALFRVSAESLGHFGQEWHSLFGLGDECAKTCEVVFPGTSFGTLLPDA
jgi:hypothetical protein